jgi:hypothetical protein
VPAFEIMDLHQPAVLWQFLGYGADGREQVTAPVQVATKWNWNRSLATGPNNTVIVLDATVIVAVPVLVNSHMWLGKLSDYLGTGSGSGGFTGADDELMIVKTTAWTKDLKGRNVRRQLGLMRLRAFP